MDKTPGVSRRDVLRAVLMAGGALALSPLLKACTGATEPAPPPAGSPIPPQSFPDFVPLFRFFNFFNFLLISHFTSCNLT